MSAKRAEYIRKLDGQSRIVIPVDIRNYFKINVGDKLEISANRDNGTIILKKAQKSCAKCGSEKNLKEISPNNYLCGSCIKNLI